MKYEVRGDWVVFLDLNVDFAEATFFKREVVSGNFLRVNEREKNSNLPYSLSFTRIRWSWGRVCWSLTTPTSMLLEASFKNEMLFFF